jgi:rhamnose transport system ATP-binding protein
VALLRAVALTKSFAGVRALKGVSFELQEREVHALVGENGAGKSTFIKIVTGAVQADSGTLEIAGREIAHNDPSFARTMGVAVIYQQPALFPDLTVAENIALETERGSLWRRIDWRTRVTNARDLLSRVGTTIDPDRSVGELSMPEQQIVEIAKAIAVKARILILDEPTASLTDQEVDRLLAIVKDLRAAGIGIIYISHRLDELFEIADRVTVFRDGNSVATEEMRDVDRPKLIRLMVGRDLTAMFPKRDVPVGDVVLETRDLSSATSQVKNVSLSVRRGEILGLSGLVGSGRTELARMLFGLDPAASGEILINGSPVRIARPQDAMEHGIAYVPEDRRHHGVIMPMSIAENITLANLPSMSEQGFLQFDREEAVAEDYRRRLDIKAPSVEAPVSSLSGGNQQKVALSRWLETKPSVLILDEPTQGVDVGAKAEIHKLMVDLAERGLAIIMISSELPEILGMSDRIAVMHGGEIRGVLSRPEATQESILKLALGHSAKEVHAE